MAPEQAAGQKVDHRADLYAFGVTLFELLTGSVPFPDGDVTYHHRHTPPPDPRTRAPDLPEGIAKLVLWLLEKDPAARPATTVEVVRALELLLAPPAGALSGSERSS
jgi:serine/threonine-protein kinase